MMVFVDLICLGLNLNYIYNLLLIPKSCYYCWSALLRFENFVSSRILAKEHIVCTFLCVDHLFICYRTWYTLWTQSYKIKLLGILVNLIFLRIDLNCMYNLLLIPKSCYYCWSTLPRFENFVSSRILAKEHTVCILLCADHLFIC